VLRSVSEGGCLTLVQGLCNLVFAFIVKRFRVFVRRFTGGMEGGFLSLMPFGAGPWPLVGAGRMVQQEGNRLARG
ncbi:hypothetical protein AAHB60_08850, partial [Pseudomonas aeruginosa]